ncbi:MAG: ribosomal protein S18-alanine N-acetyltransferase [Pseudomonadota bacterium]
MSSVLREEPGSVRHMVHGDLARVAAIERASYEFPWSQGVFRDCLLAGYHCLVLEHCGAVQGYGILSIAAGEAHVLNLCMQLDLRGYGYGGQILDEMIGRARAAEAQRVLLEVRPSNERAIRLYRKRGFLPVGSRRGYYQASGGREDALVFALPIEPARGRRA